MGPLARPDARSDRSFERLYRRHVEDVYRYAVAVLANPADAEDVTQTAFLNAYRAFRAGQRPERPLNWLIAIAHNVCRQRFRDGARRPREVVLDRELASGPADDGEERFSREDILRALSQLSFNQRAALVMRELEGRSYAEIGEILDVSVGAVETLIFRARRTFREQLEGALTCSEAERAISRDLDGMLARSDKAELRAHLRSCAECATLARRFRAQRGVLRGIAIVPLPHSLVHFSAAGGSGLVGGAALGGGLGVKVAAVGASALLVAGVSFGTAQKPSDHDSRGAAGVVSVPARSPSVAASTIARSVASTPARGSHPRRATIPRRSAAPSPGGHAVHTAIEGQSIAPKPATTTGVVPSIASSWGHSGATHPIPARDAGAAGNRGRAHDSNPAPSAASEKRKGKPARDPAGAPGQKPAEKSTPPGQAKKDSTPPGQANEHPTPPGQAKKDSTPPGQENQHPSPPGSPPSSPGPPADPGPPPNAAGHGPGDESEGHGQSSDSSHGSKRRNPKP